VTPQLSKVNAILLGGVMLLTKYELADIASAAAARRLDDMIGRHCL
jgi:hypothetical protein